MPRRPLIRTTEFPYHLRARSNNREAWPIPMESVWDIFQEIHERTVKKFEFESHAFTLMINHYHWLNSTPIGNLDEGMRYFQTETSKRISKAAGRINKVYGGRYGWSVIPSPDSFFRTYRYVYMNPVRAGACANPLVYSWSTLAKSNWSIVNPLGYGDDIPASKHEQAQWMLALRSSDDEIRIRAALRRRVFELPRKTDGFK